MVSEIKNKAHYREANHIWNQSIKKQKEKAKVLHKAKAEKINKESEGLTFRPKTGTDHYKNNIRSSFWDRQKECLQKKRDKDVKQIIKEFEPYKYEPKLNTKSLKIANLKGIGGNQMPKESYNSKPNQNTKHNDENDFNNANTYTNSEKSLKIDKSLFWRHSELS